MFPKTIIIFPLKHINQHFNIVKNSALFSAHSFHLLFVVMIGLTHFALEILVSKFRYKIISIYNTKTKWAYSVVNNQLERDMYAWSTLSWTDLRGAKTINHHIETGLVWNDMQTI